MSWKNYFYYDKRDRNAILILLLFIVISLFVYILLYKSKDNDEILQEKYQLRVDSVNSSKLNIGEVIDLNIADTLLLKRIPGIGSVYASRIVKYRELLGGYVSLLQLKEVWGVNDEIYEKISPCFTIKSNPTPLHVNHLDYNGLIKHPYLNKQQVKVILDLSKRKRNLASIKRLSLLEEFTEKDIERLKPYLSFD